MRKYDREYLVLSEGEETKLRETVHSIFCKGRGILATDERPASIGKKFDAVGVENTAENRLRFRELLYKTPGLEESIGGVILNEETFEQKDDSGRFLYEYLTDRKIRIGVKLDKGVCEMGEGEQKSVGIEDLQKRIESGAFKAATFAKWRAVFRIADRLPTQRCISKNIHVLCCYAVDSQRHGLVPIVEPEILFEGAYTQERAQRAARNIYGSLFSCLNRCGAYLPGLILKLSFLTPGKAQDGPADAKALACGNIAVIRDTVPPSTGGIVFLSGGHSAKDALAYLSEIHKASSPGGVAMSFSFARAITNGVLEAWAGSYEKAPIAQAELFSMARKCRSANTTNK